MDINRFTQKAQEALSSSQTKAVRFGHQRFIRTTLPKIAQVRELVDRRARACDVEVDGGIDVTTAPLVVRAGATVLVAGSAVFGDRDGVAAAMARLRRAVDDNNSDTEPAERSARQRSAPEAARQRRHVWRSE